MPRFRSTSRTNNTVRLFVGDKMHIKDMVREFKKVDPRFDTEATAIRYFVHLGISAQQSTENLRNSLDNTIVKNSIKDAVQNELKFHSNSIKNLESTVEELIKNSEKNFTDVARRTNKIEDKIDSAFEGIMKPLNNILITGEHTLRNIIVLRSIIYVFLLGHKTGKIESGKENVKKWDKLVTFAHERANQLSIEEVKLLSSEILETKIIQEMAVDIFNKVNSLPEPIIN